jgi:putative hydrolase of the HAD superfamily
MLIGMVIKAVGFDFFGTLVKAEADSTACVLSICNHLQQCGYEISDDDFIANYRSVVVKHRKTRYETLREVNNCILVADTLQRMGMEAEASSSNIVSAVEKYFGLWRLTLFPNVPMVLKRLGETFTISLVSNFTNSAFLHQSLKKLGIDKVFDHIIVSDAVGWRKPHPRIFKHFLKLSKAKAEEAIFLGDEIETDIMGARDMGIRAVLISRSSQVENQPRKSSIFPNEIVRSITEFEELLTADKI